MLGIFQAVLGKTEASVEYACIEGLVRSKMCSDAYESVVISRKRDWKAGQSQIGKGF